MRKLTVKDFITYNAPCFNCSNPVSFKVSVLNEENSMISNLTPKLENDTSFIVDLQITYRFTLKLKVLLISNQFQVSDYDKFKYFLEKHQIYLMSRCQRCFTTIESHFLDFNLEKGYIEPLSISHEFLMINDQENLYQIYSIVLENKSVLTADKISKYDLSSPNRIDLPLTSLSDFKNKNEVLDKIKMILTFE